MINLYHKALRDIIALENGVYNLLTSQKVESIYFFTFHKCASSLFSSYILKNIRGMKHVDYATYLWDKSYDHQPQFNYKPYGHIYGPIRLSADEGQVHDLLIKPTIERQFINDKKAIFMIRDPRDILISQYYSFGFTHPLSPSPEKRSVLMNKRNKIQSMSLEKYVLDFAESQNRYFLKMQKLIDHCDDYILLRYEDMVDDFESFMRELNTMVKVRPRAIKKIYKASRPKISIDNSSHKRSGSSNRYKIDLNERTLEELTFKLAPTLKHFGYE